MAAQIDPWTFDLSNPRKVTKSDLLQCIGTLKAECEIAKKKYARAKGIILESRSATENNGTVTKDEQVKQPSGRSKSGIFEKMNSRPEIVEISEGMYNELQGHVHAAVRGSTLKENLTISQQDTSELGRVIAFVKIRCPYIALYEVAWPVKALIAQFLVNRRDYLRKKARERTQNAEGGNTGAPSAATRTTSADNGTGGNTGDDQLDNSGDTGDDRDGYSSDVVLSDIDG